MNPLLYSSNEMFSSTELIRKSKMIFDKLLKSEIEKAIILRDGKPGFMLLDFEQYENLMKEYLELKENASKTIVKEVIVEKEPEVFIPEQKEEPIIEEIKETKKEESEEIGFSMNANSEEQFEHIEEDISEDDLKKALEEIESLSFDEEKTEEKKELEHSFDEDDLDELSIKRKEQPLKEFWD